MRYYNYLNVVHRNLHSIYTPLLRGILLIGENTCLHLSIHVRQMQTLTNAVRIEMVVLSGVLIPLAPTHVAAFLATDLPLTGMLVKVSKRLNSC